MKPHKYGLYAFDPDIEDCHNIKNILHYVGYWNEITNDDMVDLAVELDEDPQFDWINDHDWQLQKATPEMVAYWNERLKNVSDDEREGDL